MSLAGEIGLPVVLKIVSPDILHKTEAGGVLVGLADLDAVRAGYDRIVASARSYDPEASIDGVQVQAMVGAGHEVIIGAVTDQTFGKVVAFGLGGVLVEVLKDVTFRLAPSRVMMHSGCWTTSGRRRCCAVSVVPKRPTGGRCRT